MKYSLLFFSFLFLTNHLFAQATKPYWQQQVNYNIAVSLNDNDNSIDALEKIVYTNNSPDTLHFIWFHIWQNAYKNDNTAFSEQLLVNGRTDFYFSDDKDRGYTNRLDFKVDEMHAKIEVHPQHIDIVKLLLPKALAPHQSITIETPFHSKLPNNFSRGGHIGKDYQLTQWYPKPAVYDNKGWHEMPYLDQGEFYSEFGSFEVGITVPNDYLVAATGELQTATELALLKKLGQINFDKQPNYNVLDEVQEGKSFFPAKPIKKTNIIATKNIKEIGTKTLIYKQNNIHDFAWFASKNFLVQYDTVQLKSKVVDCFSFIPKAKEKRCKRSLYHIKSTLKNYSNWLGEYPYNTATVVVGKQQSEDGMEYPTITYINFSDSSWNIGELISHELGHNWFYGILASNEREHPWMDEGMNSYYDNRWQDEIVEEMSHDKVSYSKSNNSFNVAREEANRKMNALIGIQKNIAIDTVSAAYPKEYYGLIVYEKAAYWMKHIETYLGKNVFDSVMRTYYQQWQFKHPYPQDFKKIVEQVSGKNIDALFAKLYNNEPLDKPVAKGIKPAFLFPLKETNQYNHISILPAATYNFYDGIRLGIALHNYQLPLPKFQFAVNPSYGTESKAFNFFGRASYNIYKKRAWWEFTTSYQNYSYKNFIVVDDGFSKPITLQRLVPSVKLTLYNSDLRSTERTEIGFKTFYLNKQDINYTNKTNNYTFKTKSYINRLYASKFDNRVLYPYKLDFIADQTEDLLRLSFIANQFYNYGNTIGGVNVRFFAGKMFYIKSKTGIRQYANANYFFNLLGTTGEEDYTYSDFFIGRSEIQRGWRGQQIMERDGFFKTRMEYTSDKVGKTDDWLMSLNLNADFPNFPILKLYADIGTYAEAWNDNPATGRFLYTAGVQLSLLKNVVNIYVPVLNSKVFRDYNELYLTGNKFLQSISFSINLQNLHFNKLNTDVPL
jgi:hypothetical protein